MIPTSRANTVPIGRCRRVGKVMEAACFSCDARTTFQVIGRDDTDKRLRAIGWGVRHIIDASGECRRWHCSRCMGREDQPIAIGTLKLRRD